MGRRTRLRSIAARAACGRCALREMPTSTKRPARKVLSHGARRAKPPFIRHSRAKPPPIRSEWAKRALIRRERAIPTLIRRACAKSSLIRTIRAKSSLIRAHDAPSAALPPPRQDPLPAVSLARRLLSAVWARITVVRARFSPTGFVSVTYSPARLVSISFSPAGRIGVLLAQAQRSAAKLTDAARSGRTARTRLPSYGPKRYGSTSPQVKRIPRNKRRRRATRRRTTSGSNW